MTRQGIGLVGQADGGLVSGGEQICLVQRATETERVGGNLKAVLRCPGDGHPGEGGRIQETEHLPILG